MAPFAGSFAVHFAVFASVTAGHAPESDAAAKLDDVIELQPQVEDEPEIRTPAAPTKEQATVPRTHEHPYPVARSHDNHPHDPSLAHLPLATAEDAPAQPPPVVATEAAAPQFTIALGNSAQTSHTVANGAQGSGEVETAILPESGVSVAARLQSVAPATYPPRARGEQVEADVPVEIVLDAQGRVIDAKLVKRAGYGFDESALDAVRRYRFSPAQKNGQSVRVRMRWVVQFRLN